jgi:hypothetical protein
MSDTVNESRSPQPVAEPVDASPPPPAPSGRYADVWARTETRYRVRAVGLLILNFLLFCGLCVFTHWLHTAELFDFSLEGYLRPLRLWGEQTQTLNDFLLEPINVTLIPAQGVVLGLLVASIVAIPIAVAILYRFPTAVPFIAAVGVLAHMPWMAFTLTISCVLASVRPFRLSFRFGSALVGLLPVLLYLHLATRVPAGEVGAYAAPDQRMKLIATWMLAILAASIMLGVILLIASIVKFRPGAVAPVLAAMLVAPSVLFHTQVGVDELTYRVLETKHGPQSQRFRASEDASGALDALVQDLDWHSEDVLRVWAEGFTAARRRIIRPFLLELLRNRAEAQAACEKFIADHPRSRYLPNVLYIQAQVLDARLDEEALISSRLETIRESRRLRELYTDFPHPAAERPWSVLWTQYADSDLATAAAVRLAQLSLRRDDVDGALQRLTPAIERARRPEPNPTTQPRGGLLRAAPPEASLAFEPRWYLLEAQRLDELIRANRADPLHGTAPLQALASLDPRRHGYRDQLARLLTKYADAHMYDNLLVAWALAAPQVEERARLLEQIIARYPDGDALPEAMFWLADLEIQSLRSEGAAPRVRGIARMRALAGQHAHTIWGRRATQRLKMIEPAGAIPASTEILTP